MPNYKTGKIVESISFLEFQRKVNEAHLTEEEASYIWGLYYSGVRKSELYERVAEDCRIILESGKLLIFPIRISESNLQEILKNKSIFFQSNGLQFRFFSIDFHERKKHGAEVPPLELPLHWPGIDLLVKLAQKAAERNKIIKTVFTYTIHEGGPQRLIQKTGKFKSIKERTAEIRKAHYLFPNIQSTKAWNLVKQVLGENYYAHFLRLNRITEICCDPNVSLARLKSYTGIKSLDALNAYLGVSKREQKATLDFMDKQQFQEKEQPKTG